MSLEVVEEEVPRSPRSVPPATSDQLNGGQCPPGGDVIVIAIDANVQSEEAFKWYMEHLHRPKNSVILVHAQDSPAMPTRDSWESQISSGAAKRQEIVDKYNLKFKELGLQGRCVVDMEKPGPLVIDVAKQERASYIVMGTRGLGKIRRTIMGSVSDYVIHHAQCPVIVCRH